jgi:heme/copper-type cytochrome/quinol oxidase subunit 1
MRPVLLAVVALAGSAAAVAGLWFSTDLRPASIGWTAYSPLSDQPYVVPVGPPWWALALLAIGCLALGSALTLLVVRRRAR